jgi:periplasmic divalent cation tolerance protein
MKIAFVTAPPEEANGLARRLVESGSAACINVIFGVTSHYLWEGETQRDSEALLIAKVANDRADEFILNVRSIHSYSNPEVILTDVTGGSSDYIAWVNDPRDESPRPR